MDLIVKNKVIDVPIQVIIERLRQETGNKYFNFIGKPGDTNLRVTCCYHKHGQEQKPSASFFIDKYDPDVEYGFFKCFTCGEKQPLWTVVNFCFDKDRNDEFGKKWLADNFGSIISENRTLPEFKPKKSRRDDKIILDESVLNDYNFIHPYMYKRKLTNEVIARFKIGYDKDSDCITFPCWDKNGNLVAVNRRSVKGKRFELVSNVNKEIYLLNYIIKDNIDTVYVTESQINALTLETYGLRAVALLGTGCKHQYEILNKVGIRSYILALDPDGAGRQGTLRFIKSIKNCMISIKDLPDGKDVNDLTKEEFFSAPLLSIDEWCKKYNMSI